MISKIFLKPDYDIKNVINQINEFKITSKNPVVIITGPTSSGKTALAHNLYKHINALLISSDSRQIYKDASIGSSKPIISDKLILNGFYTSKVIDAKKDILYWQLDNFDLNIDYSAQKYRETTRSMIRSLHGKNVLPIIVGGTIHWLRSLTSEFISPFYESDNDLYEKLCSHSLTELQEIYLKEYSKDNINESDWNNTRRLSRAIEYKMITGKSIYDSTVKIQDKNNYLIFQISIDRIDHRKKIRNNIQARIDNGWIEEVENILNKYTENILDKLGQGYRIIGNYILGGKKITKEDLIELIVIAEMRYAKKQIF